MSRLISDLNGLLNQLVSEHRKLLEQMEQQHNAMKRFDMNAMADLVNAQESTRLRINALDVKRRGMIRNITTTLRLTEEPKLTKLAELFPPQGQGLLTARAELLDLANKITTRSQGSGKLAHAVLGHLNTVVRLLAGAVERAGLYTKRGVPQLAKRIGVMDAVG
jgi:hypothetical protein